MRNKDKLNPGEEIDKHVVEVLENESNESQAKATIFKSEEKSDSENTPQINSDVEKVATEKITPEPKKSMEAKKVEENDMSVEKNTKGRSKKSLAGIIIGSTLLVGLSVAGGLSYFSLDDEFINLVNLSGDESPNPSANEIAKLKLELQNLRNDLDQYIGVNEAVAKMDNKIVSLKQQVENLKTKLEDEISTFELDSENRSIRLSEISSRLSELKVAESITLKNQQEMEKLRVEIKSIHEKSSAAENEIIKRLDSYKQMLDLSEDKEVPVRAPSKKNNQVQQAIKKNSYGKVITKIGPLKLETVVSHGSQRVAELTDEISGAIPIIEGDRIGQYHIRKINESSVHIQNQVGEKFTLVQEG